MRQSRLCSIRIGSGAPDNGRNTLETAPERVLSIGVCSWRLPVFRAAHVLDMAKIVLIMHEFDRLLDGRPLGSKSPRYMICDVLMELRHRGHDVETVAGVRRHAPGDAAILHVDCSLVPQDYIEMARCYPLAINVAAADIRKRSTSQVLIEQDTAWSGPVIVKSNYNYRGEPERLHNRIARRRLRKAPHPGVRAMESYQVYPSPSHVPAPMWIDRDLVVEKFVPENDRHGYAMRIWNFFGDRERCARVAGPEPIIKADNFTHREEAPVPDDLRERRRQLGFDFGRFDFVVHDGRAILLDANKTPGRPPNIEGRRDESVSGYVDDLESRLRC